MLLLWPYISRWILPAVQRWSMRRLEDHFRRMTGQPTRKEERKMHRKAEKERRRGVRDGWGAFRDRRTQGTGNYGQHSRRHEPIIPKEYAEDVEFVEIKSYSEETVAIRENNADGKAKVKVESQIEDAEYVEIKK